MTSHFKLFLLAVVSMVCFQACAGCQPPCNSSIPAYQPGSCPVPGVPDGMAGGRCENAFGSCTNGPNLTCISGTCIPCGESGKTCCAYSGACRDGSYCGARSGDFDYCTNHCGSQAGLDCCAGNTCADGLQCNVGTHRCEPPAANVCDGPQPFFIRARDAWGCGETFPVKSTDSTQAQVCADQQLQQSGYERVGSASTQPLFPTAYTYEGSSFIDPNIEGTVYAWSCADAKTCAQSQVTNGTIVVNGCP